MGLDEATTGLYRPRNPRTSPLWRCVQRHYEELERSGAIRRNVAREALRRFTDCGDLPKGFACIYCDSCGHDFLLAFGCKTRYFCPSCHQKRMPADGEWVEAEVLKPVPHRQYVFTVPKRLRAHFLQRHRLGGLCRLTAGLLPAGYGAAEIQGRAGGSRLPGRSSGVGRSSGPLVFLPLPRAAFVTKARCLLFRRKQTVKSCRIHAWSWHQGRQSCNEIQRLKDDMRRAVTIGRLKLVTDVSVRGERQALFRHRRAADVTAQPAQLLALTGLQLPETREYVRLRRLAVGSAKWRMM